MAQNRHAYFLAKPGARVIDHEATQLALRTKLLALEVVTTGATSLATTATGYTRSSGSFLSQGFKPGMEILAAGFSNASSNGTGVVTAVSALTLTVTAYDVSYTGGELKATNRTLAIDSSASGRTINVPLPAITAWENTKVQPLTGAPFVEEQYLPGPTAQITIGPLGNIEITPQYNVQIHVPEGYGIGAARKYTDALLTLFAPRTAITVGSDTARVRTDTGPFTGQLVRSRAGWVVTPVTFPLRLRTANST
jgi:hypothetical protein